MKWQIILRTFAEHMAGANIPLVMFLTFFVLSAVVMIVWRWGAGFLMSSAGMLIALQMSKAPALSGIALLVRFLLVVVLVFFALFSRRNRISFSPAMGILFLLPVAMVLNSVRAANPLDMMGQGFLFLLFYAGLVLGGQKIFGDARGRSVFVKTIVLFTIVVVCLQIPYFRTSYGMFKGTFASVIGFMMVGVTGVVVLFWFGMKQRVWSFAFVICMVFAALTFVITILTGGRTIVGGVLLGILVVLSRRLGRNVVIFLAAAIILAPLGLKVITYFPGLERVRDKFSTFESSGRLVMWGVAWREAKAKPLFGWGTGTSVIKAGTIAGTHFHNSYLEWSVEHGIIFGLMMVFLFSWFPLRGLILMRDCQTEEMKNMANLSAALLTTYVFASYLGGTLLMTTGILPAYTAIALQEGVRAENQEIKRYEWAEYDEEEFWAEEADEVLSGQFLG